MPQKSVRCYGKTQTKFLGNPMLNFQVIQGCLNSRMQQKMQRFIYVIWSVSAVQVTAANPHIVWGATIYLSARGVNEWFWWKLLSHIWLFATPWIVARQAPLSMRFSKQEYWSGLPFPSPGYLPNPGIEPRSPALQADALPSEPPGKLGRGLNDSRWYMAASLD